MKQKGMTIASSCGLVCLLSLLLSLLLALLYYFNLLSTASLQFSSSIAGCLAFLVGGCYLGLHIEKKVLLHSLGIALVGILLSLFFIEKSATTILFLCLNWIFYNLGVLVAMFIKKS